MNRRSLLRNASTLAAVGSAGCWGNCMGNPQCPSMERWLDLTVAPAGWTYSTDGEQAQDRGGWPLDVSLEHKIWYYRDEKSAIDSVLFDDVTLSFYDRDEILTSQRSLGDVTEGNGYQRTRTEREGCCPSTTYTYRKEGVTVEPETFPQFVSATASIGECEPNDRLSYAEFHSPDSYERHWRDCDEPLPVASPTSSSPPTPTYAEWPATAGATDYSQFRANAFHTGSLSTDGGPGATPGEPTELATGVARVTPVVRDGTVYLVDSENDAPAGVTGYRPDGTATLQVATPPNVRSPPAVGPERLYVAEDGAAVVRAHSTDDGATVWSTSLDGDPATNPVLADGTLYVVTKGGSVYGLDAADGTRRRLASVEEDEREAPPAVDHDAVYVTSAGTLVALGREDGTGRWRREDVDGPVVTDGHSVYADPPGDELVALDRENGSRRWSATLDSPRSPAVDARRVYVPTEADELVALDRRTGSVRWRASAAWLPPTVAGDVVYALADGDEKFLALDAASGEVEFSAPLPGEYADALLSVGAGGVYTVRDRRGKPPVALAYRPP